MSNVKLEGATPAFIRTSWRAPATAARGQYLNDVHKISGLLDPPPPLSLCHSCNLLVLLARFGLPVPVLPLATSLTWLILADPLPLTVNIING